MVPSQRKNWILIRGLARGAGHWGTFQDKMAQAFENDNLYYVDIPGNGYLNHIKTPLNVSEFISYFEKQLENKNFNPQLETIGLSLSLGSMSMVEWGRQNPNLFKKMILINTSASNFSNVFKRLSFKALTLGPRLAFISDRKEKEIASYLLTTSLSREEMTKNYNEDLERLTQFSQKYAALPKNIFRQLIAAARYKFPMKNSCPTLILSGAKDQFVSPACSIDIAKAWKSDHQIHLDAGHDICFQYPDWVIDQLKEWA